MKHLKRFKRINESYEAYVVVFDGTSAYVCSPDEIDDDVEVIDSFDDIDVAWNKADEINNEAYPKPD